MTPRHLKIFVSVCEHKNMTRAAKSLYLSQPSVSQAIAELEKFYEVRLFERLNHRLYLTPAGEKLLSYARHMLNLTEQVKKELSEFGAAGILRIGASLTIGTYLLPRLLSAFGEQMPVVEVFSVVDNTHAIERMILQDEIDIGLVEGPIHSRDILEENIQTDHLVVIASPSHALSKRKNITVSDLANLKFIVRESGSGTRSIFENAIQSKGIPWKIAGSYNNIESIKQAVRANLGLAVVPKISIAEDVKMGWLIPLDVRGLNLARNFNLIYHKQKFFTPAIKALISLAHELPNSDDALLS
jgi:DNA-binding transcriptional LysR family regulator